MTREGPPPAPAGKPRALFWTLLAVALAASAGFRLSGLSWGLRHPVHRDEQDFVTRVVEMVRAGDSDHRWYQYLGLFLYLLGPSPNPGRSGPRRGLYAASRSSSVSMGSAPIGTAG